MTPAIARVIAAEGVERAAIEALVAHALMDAHVMSTGTAIETAQSLVTLVRRVGTSGFAAIETALGPTVGA